ncbi:MAG: hypothetical protein AB8H12_02580 [Lewinella sp.]
MRYSLLLMLSILTSSLFAQSTKTAQKQRWEISASFSPELNKTVVAENLQLAYIPENIPISQRPNIIPDTVMIGGVNRLFNRSGIQGLRIKPTVADFWFATNVKVHRRLGRFDFSGGLYYSQGSYTSTPTETNETLNGWFLPS